MSACVDPGVYNVRRANTSRSDSRDNRGTVPVEVAGNFAFGAHRYEEFFNGDVICPTCHGSGRIQREQDSELVALIPVNDGRLNPRRTKLYVILAVIVCAIVGGLAVSLFLPRSIILTTTDGSLFPKKSSFNLNKTELSLVIINSYDITNSNFFSVEVESFQVNMIRNQHILAESIVTSSFALASRSTTRYEVTMNATFTQADEYFILSLCLYNPSEFFYATYQATISISYYGKSEQTSSTSHQYISCRAQGPS